MSTSNSLIVCENYYLSGLLSYLGYSLVEVRDGIPTAFVFEMPQWSYDELKEAFDSDEGQSIANVRLYGAALKRLDSFQKLARRSDFQTWFVPIGKGKLNGKCS
jgi:hypothetical protein